MAQKCKDINRRVCFVSTCKKPCWSSGRKSIKYNSVKHEENTIDRVNLLFKMAKNTNYAL